MKESQIKYLLNHPDRRSESIKKYNSSDKCRTASRKRYPKNRDKIAAYGKSYRDSEVGQKVQRASRIGKYNITPERYEELLIRQGYVCAICRKPETRKGIKYLSIDHDHECCAISKASCGKCVRGLLCFSCNRRLGILENKEWVRNAQEYLEEWSK